MTILIIFLWLYLWFIKFMYNLYYVVYYFNKKDLKLFIIKVKNMY